MKLKKLAFALILTVIASSVALAAEPPKTETPAPPKAKPEQAQPVREQKSMEITGSYIKRNIRRDGRITDGSSQVVVLDRGMIDRSGAADLKQVLIRQGIR